MKRYPRSTQAGPMSAEAYAGFLKLLLTPGNRVPRPSADIDAYLRHVAEAEPLSGTVRRMIGQTTVEAA